MLFREQSKRYLNIGAKGDKRITYDDNEAWYWRFIAQAASWMILCGYDKVTTRFEACWLTFFAATSYCRASMLPTTNSSTAEMCWLSLLSLYLPPATPSLLCSALLVAASASRLRPSSCMSSFLSAACHMANMSPLQSRPHFFLRRPVIHSLQLPRLKCVHVGHICHFRNRRVHRRNLPLRHAPHMDPPPHRQISRTLNQSY